MPALSSVSIGFYVPVSRLVCVEKSVDKFHAHEIHFIP